MTYADELKFLAKHYAPVFRRLVFREHYVMHNRVTNQGLIQLRKFCYEKGLTSIPPFQLHKYEIEMEEYSRSIFEQDAEQLIAAGLNAMHRFLISAYGDRMDVLQTIRHEIKMDRTKCRKSQNTRSAPQARADKQKRLRLY